MTYTITEFLGEYRFLSNFWTCDITIVGVPYKSVEAAYQASKIQTIEGRQRFSNVEPARAKSLGRAVKLDRWTDMDKIQSMELCLRAKFLIPELKSRLISTAGCDLIEGNNWDDRFWGVCRGEGRNILGKLLMMLRDEIILYEPQYRVNDLDYGLDNSDNIPF